MASSDRAVNLPIRVQGVSDAVAGFKAVGQAGEQSIAGIAKAAAAQAQYEASLAKANAGAETFAAAQAEIKASVAQSAAEFKAGQLSAEGYAAAVLQGKNSLVAAKAEYSVLTTNLAASSKEMALARGAANDLGPALGRSGLQTNNMRMAQLELTHVMRSSTDAIIAGASPLQVMGYEASRVVESVALMSGGTSKFAEFMAGPWGLAIIGGTLLLLNLATKYLQTKNAIADGVEELKKHEEKTRNSAEAQKVFATTAEGVTQAIMDERKALDALNKVQDTAAEKAYNAALKNRENAASHRDATVAALEHAKAELTAAQANPDAFLDAPNPALAQQQAEANARTRIAAVNQQLAEAKTALATEESQLLEARAKLVVDRAGSSADDQTNRKFDARIDAETKATIAAQKLALTTIKGEQAQTDAIKASNKALGDKVLAINKARDAELKTNAASKRTNNRETGREVTPDQAAAIARSAGLQVNSVSRTYGQQKKLYDDWVAQGRPKDNPVAAPGTSAHEGAKGRWALDIQFGQGVTPDLLRKVFAAQGVNLTKVFKERGHFHVEGSRSQSDSAAAATDKAAQDEEKRQQAFNNELAGLQADELGKYRSLITNADVRDRIQKAEIDVEKKKYDDNVDSLVAQGKYSAVEGKQLKDLNDARADLAKQIVDRTADERHLQEQQAAAQRQADLADAQIGDQQKLLQGQEDLAKTQKERRDIEHRLIDLQYQEEKINNDLVISKAEQLKASTTATDEEKKNADLAIAKAQLSNASLPQRQANSVAQSDAQTAGPLEAYLRGQPRSAGEINERVEGYVVDELNSVREGIEGAITSAIGVKDPLISGLLDLLLQTVLFDPLAQILQQRAAASGSGGGIGGFLSGLLKIGSSAITTPSGGLVDAVKSNIAANPGIFASGSDNLPVGKPFYVGENGRELMTYLGDGRLAVQSNQRMHRAAPQAGAMVMVHNTINIPSRADPRKTQSTVNRGVQQALAVSTRKGLASGIRS